MYPVVSISCSTQRTYERYSFLSRVMDKFNTNILGQESIQELGLKIFNVRIPSNFEKRSYYMNLNRARRLAGRGMSFIAPKTLRVYDYDVLNTFQKTLFSFGISKSIQLILRLSKKNLSNSCILIHNDLSSMSLDVLFEVAKHARYIVLLSPNIAKLKSIREKVISDYGVTPVLTSDVEFALKAADFIITSNPVNMNKGVISSTPVWILDNNITLPFSNGVAANDISFKVPWNYHQSMSTEVLGAILCQMEEKDIERSLKYNGIYLDKIKFNDKVLEI